MFALGLFLAPSRAAAHGGPHNAYYVAPNGKDAGRCDDARRPCQTLRYAIDRVAGKGDEVHVAAGEYAVAADEVPLLLSELVMVKGGFSAGDLFSNQDPAKNTTFVSGVPSKHRERLRQRGLTRTEDRDGIADDPNAEKAPPEQLARTACNATTGMAGIYPCKGIDMLAHVPLASMSSAPTAASNIWGFRDLNDNREYVLIGITNGTAVFDVTDPEAPREVGTVRSTNTSDWRELRVYQKFDQAANRWKAYGYVSSDVYGSPGMQIIDLTNLPNSVSLAGTYSAGFTKSHTVYLSGSDVSTGAALPGQTPYIFLNGANANSGAYRIINIANPTAPTLVAAPPAGAQYTHDGTSLTITDARTADCAPNHNPCEIYVDYNEDTVDLWDVTNKAAPVKLSATPYLGSGYTHSGWWSADKQYLFIQDEYDEVENGHNSRVRTMNLANLRAPSITVSWTGPTRAIDHNGYTIGNLYYMSNYQRGLTILDISNPLTLKDVAFFDSYPAGNSANFNGAWGVYPYLPSGTLAVSDIEGGLFLLKEAPYGLTASSSKSLALVGASVAFTATVTTAESVTYSWSFGDGGTGQGATAQHTYAAPGDYTVTVTATNGIQRELKQLKVAVRSATLSLAATSNSPQPVTGSVAFTATVAVNDSVTYSWSFGDGSTGSGAMTSHTYAATGTYTAVVTATNGIATESDSVQVIVEEPAAPLQRIYLPLLMREPSQAGRTGAVAFMTLLAGLAAIRFTRKQRER